MASLRENVILFEIHHCILFLQFMYKTHANRATPGENGVKKNLLVGEGVAEGGVQLKAA